MDVASTFQVKTPFLFTFISSEASISKFSWLFNGCISGEIFEFADEKLIICNYHCKYYTPHWLMHFSLYDAVVFIH